MEKKASVIRYLIVLVIILAGGYAKANLMAVLLLVYLILRWF